MRKSLHSGVLPIEHIHMPNLTATTTLSLIYRGIAMPNSDLLPSLLFKINENQLALEAAIMELSNWFEQRGAYCNTRDY
jgi:hypothetical protein